MTRFGRERKDVCYPCIGDTEVPPAATSTCQPTHRLGLGLISEPLLRRRATHSSWSPNCRSLLLSLLFPSASGSATSAPQAPVWPLDPTAHLVALLPHLKGARGVLDQWSPPRTCSYEAPASGAAAPQEQASLRPREPPFLSPPTGTTPPKKPTPVGGSSLDPDTVGLSPSLTQVLRQWPCLCICQ